MNDLNRKTFLHLGILLLGAFILRSLGLGFGLPGPTFADEPHHINLAVSFGSGNFDPGFFKYPTLWMYLLSAIYGIVFLFWSGFGLLRTVSDYAHLFVWHPSLFYLTARLMTAACGTVGVFFIYRTALILWESSEAAFLSALFYAISPPLIFFAHQAKPDTAMLMFSTMAWFFSLRYYLDGKFADAAWAGVTLGLACSTQYTALLTSPVLLTAHVMRTLSGRRSVESWGTGDWMKIILAHALIPCFFFLASPFTLIHFRYFLSDLSDLRSYGSGALTTDSSLMGIRILFHYADAWGFRVWGLLILTVAVITSRLKNKPAFFILLIPLILGSVPLAMQNRQAGVINYAFSLFPAIFILSGSIWILLEPERRKFTRVSAVMTAIASLLCLPALIQSVRMDRDFLVEDTRLLAKKWIETNFPPETKILLDQIHTGPFLFPTKTQTLRLEENTEKGNPGRSHYYRLMAESHPGGGYEIYRIQRTSAELISPLPRHTEWSQKAQEWIDVEQGLGAARRKGVKVVVWSSSGATRQNSPRLIKYFDDLDSQARLLAEFKPESQFSPLIKIYSL